ncbi:cadherin domain-containing protein [Schlesneria sp.]|uniref:cadherin domain-containing protein n=1 Tax=Schlesneria sp. TaxID=2762018 RepID=UPI002F1D500F
MLTDPVVAAVTVYINETPQVFPYAATFGAGTEVVSISVTDPDAAPDDYTPGNMEITAGNVDYNGNGIPAFRIDVVNGVDTIVVNDPADLNYEAQNSYALTVTATDNSGATGSNTITINLWNVNDRPVIPQYPYDNASTPTPTIPDGIVNVFEVRENSFNGTVVGTVTAIDQDIDSNPVQQATLTYVLVGTVPGFNADTPAFAIDPFTGRIRVTDQSFLDYEARRVANLGQGNLGQGGLLGFPDVVFDLQVRATDIRGLSSQTYQGGNLTANGGNFTSDSHVYIRLRDVGEVPPNVANSTKTLAVNENSTVGLSVGFFQLISGTDNFVIPQGTFTRIARPGLDPLEPQQRHSFEIVGGNPNNTFAIDPDTGEITVANPLVNYETLNAYDLQIKVTDRNLHAVQIGAVDNVAPLSTVATLRITVNDVNEVTTIPNNQSFNIPENTVNGTIVGSVIANDPDTQQPNGNANLVYSIISGNVVKVNGVEYAGVFSIDPATGVISVNNTTGLPNNIALNFENQSTFALTIKVVDRGDQGTSANNSVLINLQNVNETTPAVQDATFSIAENRPAGDLVGQVIASVGELGNTITSFQIMAGNKDGAFAIDSVGRITVANPSAIDFEKNPVFNLTVRATDNGSPALFATGTITILLSNLNEQIVMLDQGPITVNENTPNGTIVGQIVTSDPDNANAPIQGQSFVINGGNTGGAFSIDPQGRIIVANSAALNFESTPTFTIVATVTDTGIPSTSMAATITIALADINDAPIIGTQSFNLKEHSLPGTVVGTVQATDQDSPAQTLTFAIIGGNDSGAFAIDPATGAIRVVDPGLIDYSSNPTFALTVQVTDNGVPARSSTATVNILLLDGQEPQIANQSKTIPENSAVGTVIATVAASNGLAPYTYSIFSGNTNNAFTINPTTGVITVSNPAALNYEAIKSFSLKVMVVDSQATKLADTATITINLTNVNEAPSLISLETAPIAYTENDVAPLTANIVAIDPDSNNASSSVIKITGNYQNGQDRLNFTNTAKITGVWDAATGTLTLTGVDSFSNYRTAIRSVTYTNLSENPNTSTRTVGFSITDDGGLTSPIVSRNIALTSVNDAPVLTGSSTISYSEADPATVINPVISVSDSDNATLTTATIRMPNYIAGQDILSFANNGVDMGNIAVQSNANGVLTLVSAGGSATLAQWTNALRAVKYANSSGNPNQTPRSVQFQVTDGSALSNVITSTIEVTAVDFPPALSQVEPGSLLYTELSTVKVSSTITAFDFDSANLSGATIQITGNYQNGEDFLQFTNTAKITGVFNAATGMLTLTGVDTVANYQTALRSVSYFNSSSNPSGLLRTVAFTVTDTTNVVSNSVVRTIALDAVNDAPVLSGIEETALDYLENTAPNYGTNNTTPISSTIQVNDPDSLITQATIRITGNYVPNQDFLRFTNTATIIGTWNAANGTLTLTGPDTAANYAAALQSVAFYNLHNAPNTSTRTVSYTVTDDGGAASGPKLTSNTVSREINVIAVNDPPVLTSSDTTVLAYTEDATAVKILPNVLAADPDSDNLMGARIWISSNYNANGSKDMLVFVDTAKIKGSWDPATGILTLSGVDSVSNYRTALRSIGFANSQSGLTAPNRTVSFSVIDDQGLSGNTVTRNISIATHPNGAVLSGIETVPAIYKANDPYTPPAPVTSTLVISDNDSTLLRSAVIKISGNYVRGQDQLLISGAVANANQISAAWNSATGELTLSGLVPVVNYINALRDVKYYNNGSSALSTLTRTITFTVIDDTQLASNIATRNVTIQTTNTAPFLNVGGSSPLQYQEKDAATNVVPALTVQDVDSPNIVSAAVKITGNYQQGQDQLVFSNTAKIKGSWDVLTGTLNLTGVDTRENYEAALRTVKYLNTSNNPSTLTRTVGVTVNDGLATSNVVSRNVTILALNDPPQIATNEAAALNYKPSQGAVSIAPSLSVTDPDSANITGATVRIAFNYQQGNDQLSFVNTAKITGTFDILTGILTLSGSDTVANYRTALQSVKYQFNGVPLASIKTISFVANDGLALGNLATRDISVTPNA